MILTVPFVSSIVTNNDVYFRKTFQSITWNTLGQDSDNLEKYAQQKDCEALAGL